MKNIIILFLSLIFSLLFCEILLRYVFVNETLKIRVEANQKQFKDFQQLTWDHKITSFKPLSEGMVIHPEYKYKIKHDEIGFRNPCISKKKRNIKNIIVGDSFVYGVGVKDMDTLNCNIKKDNYTMGVPNAGPKCYVDLVKRHLFKIKNKFRIKDKINIHIIFYMGNDYEKIINLGSGCPFSKNVNEIIESPKGLINKLNFILTRGVLSNLYLPQIPKLLYKNYLNNKKYKNLNKINNKYFSDNGNDTFYTDIKHINQLKLTESLKIINNDLININIKNLNVIYYLVPSGSDVSKERLIRKSNISGFNYKIIDTNLKYKTMINSCKELNITCKDLRRFFVDENFYYHDTHLNYSGVKILSKIIDVN